MSEWTKAELATRDLDVTRAGGIVLVNDGQTRWICEATAYDEVVESLSTVLVDIDGMDSHELKCELQREESLAYAELCDRITGPVISTGGNGQGDESEQADLVARAVAAGMLSEDDPLVKRYTAMGQGE